MWLTVDGLGEPVPDGVAAQPLEVVVHVSAVAPAQGPVDSAVLVYVPEEDPGLRGRLKRSLKERLAVGKKPLRAARPTTPAIMCQLPTASGTRLAARAGWKRWCCQGRLACRVSKRSGPSRDVLSDGTAA